MGRNAQLIDKQLVYAVFIDKLKITEYGSVQYIKAHEYKQKHASQTRRGNEENQNSNRSPSDGQHTKREGSNHDKVRKRVPAAVGQQDSAEESQKRVARAQHWQLDDKVTKKLDNIINRIGEVEVGYDEKCLKPSA